MIFWKTVLQRKRVGWVADFCPMCRELRRHRLFNVSSTVHAAFVTAPSGQRLRDEIECETCRAIRTTTVKRHGRVTAEKQVDLDTLLRRARDDHREALRQRVVLEERLAGGALTAPERADLLVEPIAAAVDAIERQRIARETSPAARVMLPAGVALLLLAFAVPGPAAVGVGVIATASIGASAFLFLTPMRWFLKHRLRPQLTHALTTLRPAAGELREAFDRAGPAPTEISAPVVTEWLAARAERSQSIAPK